MSIISFNEPSPWDGVESKLPTFVVLALVRQSHSILCGFSLGYVSSYTKLFSRTDTSCKKMYLLPFSFTSHS